MREEVTRVIENNEYVFTTLPVKTSIKTLTKLTKLIVGPIGSAINGKDTISDALGDIDVGSLISGLSDRLDEDEVYGIIETFAGVILHKGQRLSSILDAHFGGNPALLLKVIGAALEIEYANFFGSGGVQGLISTLKDKEKKRANLSPVSKT